MAKSLLCQCIVFLCVSSFSGFLFKDPPEKEKSSACDGGITITNDSGWFSSPGYDGKTDYQQNLMCFWMFHAPPGKVYQFSFKAFSVELSTPCIYDRLIVTEYVNEEDYSLPRELDILCGNFRIPDDIIATTNEISFRFISDSSSQELGFNVTYKLISSPCTNSNHLFKCGGEDRCLNQTLVCDGVEDCEDGSDEIVCYNSSDCGISIIPPRLTSPRILGGNVAVEGSWPWAVSLHDETGKHRCGATIVHPRWVITAAHCFPNGLQNHSVIAGRYNRTETNRNEQIVYVDNFYKLKSFNIFDKRDDIAVVRLKEPFSITDYVRSVCFPESKMKAGQYGWQVGWGFTKQNFGFEDEPCCEDRLKQATMPVINHTLCNSVAYYQGKILPHMMCAGYADGRADGCEGDSGGPFVMQRSDDKRWELQGITSWGDGCGQANKPGVFTALYDYLPWIRRIISKNNA